MKICNQKMKDLSILCVICLMCRQSNMILKTKNTVKKSFFFNFLMFLMSFQALTHSIFIFLKVLFRFEFSITLLRKSCIT